MTSEATPSLGGRLLLALISGLVTLCALEVGFRLAERPGRRLGAVEFWRPEAPQSRPIPRTVLGGVEYREAPITQELFSPGVTRILLLGDSFTYGAGLPSSDKRFSDLVETRLNADVPGTGPARRYHVFNAGVGGSAPLRWRGYLEALLSSYRPHIVFAVFFLRDGTRLPTALMVNQGLIEPIARKWEGMPLYEHSALLRFFYDRLSWRDYSDELVRRLRAGYLGSPEERSFWKRQQRALEEMAARCASLGIPFHLVLFPLLFDLESYAFADVEAEIGRFAADAGLPVFSLTPGFLGQDARSLWVSRFDQHPNEEGHEIAAKTLLPYLRSSLDRLEGRRDE